MNGSTCFCSNCGQPLVSAQAPFCTRCGARQNAAGGVAVSAGIAVVPAAAAPAPVPAYPLIPAPTPAAPAFAASEFRGYGGFWIRLVAMLIDSVALSVVILPIYLILAIAFGVTGALGAAGRDPGAAAPAVLLTLLPMFLLIIVAVIAINWLYEALMTSSAKQATLGKMAVRLKVVDSQGNRLSFLHATARHFAKMINGFTFNIGYMMAGFTERKQALHDYIVGTYVIKT